MPERMAARVLVMDADGAVLLLCGHDPAQPDRGAWWFTPGGGLEAGEDPRRAARRELFEETGLAVDDLDEPVHERRTEFDFDHVHYEQHEHFFCARVARFDVDNSHWSELERRVLDGARWWTRAELETTNEMIYPENLAEILARVLQ